MKSPIGLHKLSPNLAAFGGVKNEHYFTVMKVLAIILIVCLNHPGFAQFKLVKLNKATIPKEIVYENNIIRALRWNDKLGENIVLLTSLRKGPVRELDPTVDSFCDIALEGNHFLVGNDSLTKAWHVNITGQCPIDAYFYFVDKCFAITDLNADGIAEVWVMYRADCGFGLRSVATILTMHEGDKEYKSDSHRNIYAVPADHIECNYTLDDNFQHADLRFKQYADYLWTKANTDK